MLNIKIFIIMKTKQETANLTLAQKCAALNQELQVGYYVFSSGVVSKDKNADSQISGVIIWKNSDESAEPGSRALMITLDRVKKAWSNLHRDFGGTNEVDGKANTQAILQSANKQGLQAPAAIYCNEYAERGVSAGEGFLPSKEQLLQAAKNYDCINSALTNAGVPGLYGIYVSSTEYNKDREWEVRLENRSSHVYAKSYGGDYVRCFVAL